MRHSPIVRAEQFRIRHGVMASDSNCGNNGAFVVPFKGYDLTVVVSDGDGWDHVSVSLRSRCPTWEEMDFIKNLFFCDDECVMQLHPPRKDWVNYHPNCLHLWRPQNESIPRPPKELVGPQLEIA